MALQEPGGKSAKKCISQTTAKLAYPIRESRPWSGFSHWAKQPTIRGAQYLLFADRDQAILGFWMNPLSTSKPASQPAISVWMHMAREICGLAASLLVARHGAGHDGHYFGHRMLLRSCESCASPEAHDVNAVC